MLRGDLELSQATAACAASKSEGFALSVTETASRLVMWCRPRSCVEVC